MLFVLSSFAAPFDHPRAPTNPCSSLLTAMPADLRYLSEDLRAQLSRLNELLIRLNGTTKRKLPMKGEDVADFGREIASTVSQLAMYNESLLKRVVDGEAIVGNPDPARFKEITRWADLPDRQPPRRVVERRLRAEFESLRLTLLPLSTEALAQVPTRPEEILEFLTLSMTVQSHLAWFLDVGWFQRAFPEKPPPWVRKLGKSDCPVPDE